MAVPGRRQLIDKEAGSERPRSFADEITTACSDRLQEDRPIVGTYVNHVIRSSDRSRPSPNVAGGAVVGIDCAFQGHTGKDSAIVHISDTGKCAGAVGLQATDLDQLSCLCERSIGESVHAREIRHSAYIRPARLQLGYTTSYSPAVDLEKIHAGCGHSVENE